MSDEPHTRACLAFLASRRFKHRQKGLVAVTPNLTPNPAIVGGFYRMEWNERAEIAEGLERSGNQRTALPGTLNLRVEGSIPSWLTT